eukprot:1661247-Prymnesium_polylepis.2
MSACVWPSGEGAGRSRARAQHQHPVVLGGVGDGGHVAARIGHHVARREPRRKDRAADVSVSDHVASGRLVTRLPRAHASGGRLSALWWDA